VLVRADLNVPLRDGAVADDFRIRAFLPTLDHLVAERARIVVCSHLGRPKGPDDAYRLRPVAGAMAKLIDREVTPVPEVVGRQAEAAVSALEPGHIVLLENLRFEPGETSNDPAFADALASLAEFYVNDAFGSCHRAHASVVGVPQRLPSAAGFLLADEVENLSELLGEPKRPFVVVLGGAKVADKIGVVRHLLGTADRILIGGGMCFTFLKAAGRPIGRSLLDADHIADVEAVLQEAGDTIRLPTDIVYAPGLEATEGRTGDAVPDDQMGLDIGAATADAFAREIEAAGTVFWNGPMGVFENAAFAGGTQRVAEAVARCPGKTVTGGGDTAAALAAFGLDEAVDFLSTGGGASLEFLEGRTLPGIAALAAGRQPEGQP
jgi:phosphoglycerate kinase